MTADGGAGARRTQRGDLPSGPVGSAVESAERPMGPDAVEAQQQQQQLDALRARYEASRTIDAVVPEFPGAASEVPVRAVNVIESGNTLSRYSFWRLATVADLDAGAQAGADPRAAAAKSASPNAFWHNAFAEQHPGLVAADGRGAKEIATQFGMDRPAAVVATPGSGAWYADRLRRGISDLIKPGKDFHQLTLLDQHENDGARLWRERSYAVMRDPDSDGWIGYADEAVAGSGPAAGIPACSWSSEVELIYDALENITGQTLRQATLPADPAGARSPAVAAQHRDILARQIRAHPVLMIGNGENGTYQGEPLVMWKSDGRAGRQVQLIAPLRVTDRESFYSSDVLALAEPGYWTAAPPALRRPAADTGRTGTRQR